MRSPHAMGPLWRRAVGFAAVLAFAGVASAQSVEIDQPAPELDVKLLNGKTLKAKKMRGKVVVNMVWATWSPAARMELPDIQRIYDDHRAAGLEVVALAIDENAAEVREFWRQRGYSFPAGMRSDTFFEHYGRASTTPMFYIVDRGGILRHRIAGTIGRDKLEALLKPLLAAPVPTKHAASK